MKQVFFGPVREPHHEGHGKVPDLNGREIVTLVPIMALCVFLGVYPKPFLDTVKPELQFVSRLAAEARDRAAKRGVVLWTRISSRR